jgi:hypothetical protein
MLQRDARPRTKVHRDTGCASQHMQRSRKCGAHRGQCNEDWRQDVEKLEPTTRLELVTCRLRIRFVDSAAKSTGSHRVAITGDVDFWLMHDHARKCIETQSGRGKFGARHKSGILAI